MQVTGHPSRQWNIRPPGISRGHPPPPTPGQLRLTCMSPIMCVSLAVVAGGKHLAAAQQSLAAAGCPEHVFTAPSTREELQLMLAAAVETPPQEQLQHELGGSQHQVRVHITSHDPQPTASHGAGHAAHITLTKALDTRSTSGCHETRSTWF